MLDNEQLTYLKTKVNEYETTKPRMDELIFVQDLVDKLGVERKEVLRLIKEARRGNL